MARSPATAQAFNNGPNLTGLDGSDGNFNTSFQPVGGAGLVTTSTMDYQPAGGTGGLNRSQNLTTGSSTVKSTNQANGSIANCMNPICTTANRGNTPEFQICWDCWGNMVIRMLGG